MTAVGLWLRSALRRRWRSWSALVLLLGLFGGAALLTASGARRTQTAERRFMAASNAGQLQLNPIGQSGMAGLYDDIRALPDVTGLGVIAGEPLLKVGRSGNVDLSFPVPTASADGRFMYDIYRPNVRAGRLPDPSRPYEAFAGASAVRRDHLHVGSHLTLTDVATLVGQTGAEPSLVPPGRGTPVTLTIVGVGVFPEDVVASASRLKGETANGDVYLTPAYYRTHGGPQGAIYDGAAVVLRPNTDLGRLRAKVQAIAAGHTGATLFGGAMPPGGIDFTSQSQRVATVERAVRPQVAALAAFAAIVGLGSALVVGQALARQVRSDQGDVGTLEALGMGRARVVTALIAPALATAALGAAIAVGVAVAASPLMPVGPARLAEPHPGVAANTVVLGVGFVVLLALMAARVVVTAWRVAARGTRERTAEDVETTSRLVEGATRAALPAPAITGLRMAVQRRRGGAVVSGAIAVAAVLAAVTFSANLSRLFSAPDRYGWSWDMAVDAGFAPVPAAAARQIFTSVGGVAAYAGGDYGGMTVGSRAVPSIGIDQLHGTVFPTVLEGRAPRTDGEIALGSDTLRRLGRSVGDAVDVASASGTRTVRIVGRAVFPAFERGGFVPTDLGDGAAATAHFLYPGGSPLGEAYNPAAGPSGGAYNFYLIRFASGAPASAVRTRIERAFSAAGCARPMCAFYADRRPSDVTNYARARWTAPMLAGVLALLATITLAHALVTSVRQRRRELAVLKSVGFVRRQISATVAWQATAVAVAVLLVGLPVGIAGGRWLWALFAHQIGVAPDPLTPLVAILVAIPVTVVVANAAAAIPAWSAARVRPAEALRTE